MTRAPSRAMVAKNRSKVRIAAQWRWKPRRMNQPTGADRAIAITIAKNSMSRARTTLDRNQSSTTAAPAASARPSQDEKTAPGRAGDGGSMSHS